MLRYSLVCVLFVFLPVVTSYASQNEAFPTNLELVEMAIRQAIDSVDVSRPPDASLIQIKVEGAGSGGWLVKTVTSEHLLKNGWRVLAEDTSSDTTSLIKPDYVLSLKVASLGLIYGRQWRRYLVGPTLVERVARAAVYYELVDRRTNAIVASSSVKGELSDIVPAGMLNSLIDERHDFASPELEKSRWDQYLEGGLVIAIMGVLVYLFYSNRTASS